MIWTNIKAAEWINRLPESRKGLCAGCKMILQALWDHVDQSVEADTDHMQSPWVSVETLAESRGTKPDTVQARLDKLTALGWIRRERGRRLLAWARPFSRHEPVEGPGLESRKKTPTDQDSSPDRPGFKSRPTRIQVPTDQDSSPDNQATDQPIEPSQEHAKATPRKARQRREPIPMQPGFGFEGETDPFEQALADLLAEHERLRAEAYAANSEQPRKWPGPKTDAGVSLRERARQALRVHGAEACRRALRWQAAEWRADPKARRKYSTDSMWSPKSLAVSIPRSAGQAPARASPPPRNGSWIARLPVRDSEPPPMIEYSDDDIPF